jgi:hypothetical protein
MEIRREPSLTVGLAPPLLRSNTLLGHYPVVLLKKAITEQDSAL